MVAVPRDAATVMLLRDAPGSSRGIEVLLVRRSSQSRFVPGAYVFPGGRVDEADGSPDLARRCRGLDRGEAARRIPDLAPPQKALGAWVAAIREVFEEVGLLFASHGNGRLLNLGACPHLENLRRDLHAGRLSLRELIEREGLWLEAGSLHYAAHWITPLASPIRYDVRFFVARAPPQQTPCHDGVELTEHLWIRPRDALLRHAAGAFPIILPTRYQLAQLSRFSTVDAALAATRGKPVPAILSQLVRRDGVTVEVLPDGMEDEEDPPGGNPPG